MNMSSNLSYTQTGDYLLPNLTLHQPKTPLGKYGRLRRTYLKEHRPVLYNTMKKRMRNARIICKTFRHSGTRQKKTCWH